MSRRTRGDEAGLAALALAAFVLWQPALVGRAFAALVMAFTQALQPLFVFPH